MNDMTAEQARARINQMKTSAALQGDDEDLQQLRNVLKATETMRHELDGHRTKLAESGHYTREGLAEAMKNPVTTALKNLNSLHATYVEPRVKKLQSEIDSLPAPTLPELDAMERHRLVTTFLGRSQDEQMRTLAHISESPKLATALALEDPAVTGLTPEMVGRIRSTVEDDPVPEKRAALTTKFEAVQAALGRLDEFATHAKNLVA